MARRTCSLIGTPSRRRISSSLSRRCWSIRNVAGLRSGAIDDYPILRCIAVSNRVILTGVVGGVMVIRMQPGWRSGVVVLSLVALSPAIQYTQDLFVSQSQLGFGE